jgi:ethanolamine-phosphate cytidylyltransferase
MISFFFFFLQNKILAMSDSKKPVRAWVDGCFDMMHFGVSENSLGSRITDLVSNKHANALRQAKQLCDYLIVGVHSDSDIEKNKGPPVMNEKVITSLVGLGRWLSQDDSNVWM